MELNVYTLDMLRDDLHMVLADLVEHEDSPLSCYATAADWSAEFARQRTAEGWELAPDLGHALLQIWLVAHMTARELRQKMGLSQSEFAARFFVPLRTVQGWESGRRQPPRYVLLLMAKDAGLLTF